MLVRAYKCVCVCALCAPSGEGGHAMPATAVSWYVRMWVRQDSYITLYIMYATEKYDVVAIFVKYITYYIYLYYIVHLLLKYAMLYLSVIVPCCNVHVLFSRIYIVRGRFMHASNLNTRLHPSEEEKALELRTTILTCLNRVRAPHPGPKSCPQ